MSRSGPSGCEGPNATDISSVSSDARAAVGGVAFASSAMLCGDGDDHEHDEQSQPGAGADCHGCADLRLENDDMSMRMKLLERIVLEIMSSGAIDAALVPSLADLSPARSGMSMATTVAYGGGGGHKRAFQADAATGTPLLSKRVANRQSPAAAAFQRSTGEFPPLSSADGYAPADEASSLSSAPVPSGRPARVPARARFSVHSDGVEQFRAIMRDNKSLFTDCWHDKSGDVHCAVRSDDAQQFQTIAKSAGVPVTRFSGDRVAVMFRNIPESLSDDALGSLLGCHVLRVIRRKSGAVVVHVLPSDARLIAGVRILDPESFTSFSGFIMFEERRCFQCLEMGHFANACTAAIACSKCCQSGHERKDCAGRPHCPRCQLDGHSVFEYGKCKLAVPQ
jgi:hypothetical protein